MIKPDIIIFSEIRKIADDFRLRYCDGEFPIPIEEVLEFKLNVEVRPVREFKDLTEVDAVLSNDLKVIFVDQNLFDNPKYLFRLRFALAHELGHIILHGPFYRIF